MKADQLKQNRISTDEMQALATEALRKGLDPEVIEEQVNQVTSVEFGNAAPEVRLIVSSLGAKAKVKESKKLAYRVWFVCSKCQKTRRYLYHIGNKTQCLKCHKLSYKRFGGRKSDIVRLILTPQERRRYIESGLYFKVLRALEATFAIEEAKKRGIDLVNDIYGTTENNI